MKHDKYHYYQNSVQCVEAEIDFVDATFKQLRGRSGLTLREDFCGTAATSCEWVKRSADKQAWGVDLDTDVLNWSQHNNIAALTDQQRRRIQVIQADVRGQAVNDLDIVLAMNFSYFIFMQPEEMVAYFTSVYASLSEEGIFFLDAFGGYEAAKELTEERDCDGFTYIWDQASFNPINSQMQCYIHFETADGARLERAFSYYWRLWTLPEITHMLKQAGFSTADVYWEGTDPATNEGNGVYEKTDTGSADAGWICYIVAEK